MAWSASASSAGLVVAGGVQAEVSDEFVAGQDRGVVLVEDDGDGAAGPDHPDVDAVAVHVDVAAPVDDEGVGFWSWCGVRDRVAGLRRVACLPA